MLKRLAQQKKLEKKSTPANPNSPSIADGAKSTSTGPSSTMLIVDAPISSSSSIYFSMDQIQQRVQDEVSACPMDNRLIEYEKFFSHEQKNNKEEAAVILRRVIEDRVLQFLYSLQFPNVDNMLHFELLVRCETLSKKSLQQHAGEENIALVQNSLSPLGAHSYIGGGLLVDRDVNRSLDASFMPVTEDQRNSSMQSSQNRSPRAMVDDCTSYAFEFVIGENFPSVCPTVLVKHTDCQRRMNDARETCSQLMKTMVVSGEFGFLRNLIDRVKELVIQIERRIIEERCAVEVKRVIERFERECSQETARLISDHETSIQEGRILIKSDTGVVKSAIYNNRPIALRTLLYKVDGSEIPDLIHETNVLCQLAHANILQYVGYYLIREKHYFKIALEPFSRGNLHDLLHKKPTRDTLETRSRLSDPNFLLSIARSVAQGLAYLHSKNIIHRNLKPHLVFLLDNFTAKIGMELNHCYYLQDGEIVSRKGIGCVGLPQYKSPEEFANLPQSKKVDVYAYGVLLAELYSGKKPWRETISAKICQAVTEHNHRPDLPENAPQLILGLINQCWSRIPDERPSFDQIVKILTEISL